MARITYAQRLEALEQTAMAAISHVAVANYNHRERTAREAVRLSLQSGKYVDPDDLKE